MTVNWDAKISNFEYDFTRIGPSRILMENPELLVHYTVAALAENLFSNAIGIAHYIPASRSGILLGHKTLASLIVGRSSLAWVEPMKEIPRLPGVITDLIQALLLLRRTRPPGTKLQKVVSFLEGEVARGTVDMVPSAEYPEIFYENETGRFQLHQVSSMVSEVAPFVLFLKYLVRPGHLFIIEEPESHLDAGNQRNLAQAIAMLVNAGVKVLITTHSDYFVNQINNLLALSQLTARRRAARGYAANKALKPDDVGAYQFRPGDHGSSVETLEITPDYGIPTDMFTDVHSDLYNEAIVLEHSRQ
jgi:predicted ATPase